MRVCETRSLADPFTKLLLPTQFCSTISFMRLFKLLLIFLFLSGCSSASALLGTEKLNPPPEYHQKVLLQVSDEAKMHQAPLSSYDVGDLSAFHIQHTLPILIEDAFKEIFGQVEMVKNGPSIDIGKPDVPAVFEVRLLDVANDNSFEQADHYQGEVTLGVAMKGASDQIFWQKTFRGEGYVQTDPEHPLASGPNDALESALHDAVDQMQKEIVNSQQVRIQMKYYKQIEDQRKKEQLPAAKMDLQKESQNR